MAEGLDRARIADLRAGLSDGARAAFLDARLSAAERQIVVTALSHDPGERAEISSAADLLDSVGTDLIPLPPGLLAKAAAAFAAENSAAGHGVAVPGRRTWRRQALLIVGVGLAAFVLVMTAVAGLLSPGTLAPSAEPVSSARPTAQSATKSSEGAAAGRALDHAIVLAPDANERTKSISARGESVATTMVWSAIKAAVTIRARPARQQTAPRLRGVWLRWMLHTDHKVGRQIIIPPNRMPMDQICGPHPRATHAFRLWERPLTILPWSRTGRAVLLFGQFGNDLVDHDA